MLTEDRQFGVAATDGLEGRTVPRSNHLCASNSPAAGQGRLARSIVRTAHKLVRRF